MDRKKFISRTFLTAIAGMLLPRILNLETDSKKTSSEILEEQVGFNHLPSDKAGLPNEEENNMNMILHKAYTRGHANHGWLNTYHSFSFANYYNPKRMHFGVLRVLNDDVVAPSEGFGTHPHDNMEIISIPLSGDLEHKDSMGNVAVIKQGDVQVMSAGTGVFHSEYNKNDDQDVHFLQIWVYPNEKNVTPRYDQVSLREIEKPNEFYQILSPNKEDQGVWIHQDAWFHMGKFDRETQLNYKLKNPENGVYAFILEGQAEIEGQALEKRDGLGIWDINTLEIQTESNTEILLMEVPMTT